MNTKKVETNKVKTSHIDVTHPISDLGSKRGIFIIRWLTIGVFAYTVLMFFIVWGTMFVKNEKYTGFIKNSSNSMAGWAIFIIILTCIALALVIAITAGWFFKVRDSKTNYLIKELLFICLVLIYLLIIAGSVNISDQWLWKTGSNAVGFGGINICVWLVVFCLFIMWDQVNHFWGIQIKTWHRKMLNKVKSSKKHSI